MPKRRSQKRTLIPKGDEIVKLRQGRGWSQERLLQELDKLSRTVTTISPVQSKNTLLRIENGRRAFPKSLAAIARVFGVPLSSIVEDDLGAGDGLQQLDHQPDIDNTYQSMWNRIEATSPKRVWATYLNPDAFATGEPPADLAVYYAKAEALEAKDYRRVFGLYPAGREHEEHRRNSINWIRGHVARTRKLAGYQVRYVELTVQAAEVLIDDHGVNFSFPSARAAEAGWATTDRTIMEIMKDYFQQVWDRARPAGELLA